MRRRLAIVLAVVLAGGLGLTTTHPALAAPSIRQVSLTRGGEDPVRESSDPSVSADGRLVAFTSVARLLRSDDNTYRDVYVRNTRSGAMVRASVDTEGGDPNDASYATSISADGRYVAYYSFASDLVAGDGNGLLDVFVRDLVARTTIRASVDTGGEDADGYSASPSISADGRYVAFHSYASDLVQGADGEYTDVFVRDLVAGTTVRASVDFLGYDVGGASLFPSISADGRYVAFASPASDLVQGDGNDADDVFVRDLMAGTTMRASVDTGGGDANRGSGGPSISADGRYVAFHSGASDLVQNDGNGLLDIFVRNLVSGTTVRASVDTEGGDPNSYSEGPSISGAGRYVAYYSFASDLVAGDGNGTLDVFVRDLVAGTTVRVSVDTGGVDADSDSLNPSISATGRSVAFESWASDLVQGGDLSLDVFISWLW